MQPHQKKEIIILQSLVLKGANHMKYWAVLSLGECSQNVSKILI